MNSCTKENGFVFGIIIPIVSEFPPQYIMLWRFSNLQSEETPLKHSHAIFKKDFNKKLTNTKLSIFPLLTVKSKRSIVIQDGEALINETQTIW